MRIEYEGSVLYKLSKELEFAKDTGKVIKRILIDKKEAFSLYHELPADEFRHITFKDFYELLYLGEVKYESIELKLI